MPISDGVPYWASADPDKHVGGDGARSWEVTYRPTRAADYGDVVGFVVEHFSALGVHAFQLWNEPNHPRFWPSGPSASEYLPLLHEGYQAAKRADPASTVLLGGLSKSDFYYLEELYRLGGGDYFDAVAVQPYTYGVDPAVAWKGVHEWEDPDRISTNAFPAIKEVRASMVSFGDAEKDVWLTEFGYSTTSQDGGVSAARQATYLAKAYRYVERFPWVKALFWYAARNSPFFEDANTYEGRFGLATTDWRLKPSYAALRAYALRPARPRPAQGPAATAARLGRAGGTRDAARSDRPRPGHSLGADVAAARPRPAAGSPRLGHSRPPAHRSRRRLPRAPRRSRLHRPLPRPRPLRRHEPALADRARPHPLAGPFAAGSPARN